MKLTAQQVYDRLVNVEKIKTQVGQITFSFGSVNIVVKQRDVVGNLVQEWLQGWFDKQGIEYDINDNSQMPPDFFLDTANHKINLLEVKAFNRSASAAFDIADFRAYVEELIREPWMLNVDYLIFGYDMAENGDVTIKDIWLKKVWEISRPMETWPINLQVKQNVVHKIRPATWYSTKQSKFRIFETKEDFLSAVEETIWQNDKTRPLSNQWKRSFQKAWKDYYGTDIEFPRWNDIKDKYINPSKYIEYLEKRYPESL